MVTLSLAIPHVPDDARRRSMLASLLSMLGGAQELARETVRWSIVRDVERKGIWPTAQNAWLSYSEQATHHLVLQDDLAVCLKLLATVKQLLALIPAGSVLSLFSVRRAVAERIRLQGAHWYVSHDIRGQAMILPVEHILPFLRWSRQHFAPSCPHDDVRMQLYLYDHGILAYHPLPSLVDHLGWNQSTVGHNYAHYQTAWYIGNQTDPAGIDWRTGLAEPYKVEVARSQLAAIKEGWYRP